MTLVVLRINSNDSSFFNFFVIGLMNNTFFLFNFYFSIFLSILSLTLNLLWIEFRNLCRSVFYEVSKSHYSSRVFCELT